MAKLSTRGLIIVALILSFITSALVYSYLKSITAATTKEGQPVVVAKADIPPKARITAEMVQVVKVPAEYIQPGAVTDIGQVVGVLAREQIIAGEQVTQRRLVIEGKAVGFAGVIPRDKRAVTVAVTEVTGVAGFVKPGDYVDVIVTFDTATIGENVGQIFLQNVRVLAASRDSEAGVTAADAGKKEVSKTTTTVTLAVSPDEATRLAVADEKGKIRLALRPYLPADGIVQVAATKPRDLISLPYAPAPPATATPAPAPAPAPSKGIQLIRGTKAETVPVQ